MRGRLALFLFCLVLRSPTFLRSVIDWDESLYLLIARDWARGVTPYTGIWDHKPVGTYALLRLFCPSDDWAIFGLRLSSVVFVFLSACFLESIARRLYDSKAAGVVAAVLYPVLSLHLGGVASNTELYFTAFTLAGAWFLLRAADTKTEGDAALTHSKWTRDGSLFWLGAGLAGGAAFQVKYLVLVELAYLGALACVWHARRRRLEFKSVGLALLGFALPSLVAIGSFWLAGAGAAFWDANVAANARHAGAKTAGGLGLAVDSALRWLTATLAVWAVFVLSRLSSSAAASPLDAPARPAGFLLRQASRLGFTRLDAALFGWLAVTLFEAALTGKFYSHYFLPSLAPVSLLAASIPTRLFSRNQPRSPGDSPSFVVALTAALAIAVVPLYLAVQREYQPWLKEARSPRQDPVQKIADEIGFHLGDERSLYVVNHEPILYLLTRSEPATRFVFPPFLLDPHFSAVARVTPRDEFTRILARRPKCVVSRPDTNPLVAEFYAMLPAEYEKKEVARDDLDLRCLKR